MVPRKEESTKQLFLQNKWSN